MPSLVFVCNFANVEILVIAAINYVSMKYPAVSEYIESLRIASDNLATLTSLKLVLGTEGNPIYSKEGHGIVFRMKDGNTDLEYDC